jgi:outer membrane usher protein
VSLRQRRRMSALLATFILCGLILSIPVVAEVVTAPNEAPARTFVTLNVNDIDHGEAIAILSGSDVMLTASTLSKAGVPLDGAKHFKLYDDDFVSLKSLGPKITFTFDSDNLVVNIVLPPSVYGTKRIELQQTRPESFRFSHDHSAFLNYAVTADSQQGMSYFSEMGGTIGTGRIYSSFNDDPHSLGLTRGLSNFMFDSPNYMRRTILGDALAVGGDLGGSPYLTGIQVGRAFDLNPYFVRFPTLAFSGSISAPGRADIYVNGVLVRSVPLQPGQFSLQGVVPPSGVGNTQVVVTDALGHTATFGGPFYSAESLLTKGLTDYQYSVGFMRPNAFAANDYYSHLAYVGSYHLGLTNSLTLGGRLEGTSGVVSGGPELDLGTSFGSFHFTGALSRSGPTGGEAGDFAYGYAGRKFGFSAAVFYESDGYATTTLAPTSDRPIFSDSFSANVAITPRIGFTGNLSRDVFRDSGSSSSASVYLGLAFRSGISLNVGVARTLAVSPFAAPSNQTQYFVTMLLPSHGRATQTGYSQTQNGKTTITAENEQPVPVGVGFGYRVGVSNDPNAILSTDERYNGPIGTYELVTGLPRAGKMDSLFTLAGGVADVNGELALSRPLTDSFALVDVPGQSHIDVYLNGQDMGKTNKSGKLVVPNVIPNYDNRINIAEQNTAMNTEITTEHEFIAPGVRSGAIVAYGVKKVFAFTGKLVVRKDGKDLSPALGAFDLVKGSSRATSDLGDHAEFYFENVAAGEYVGTVRYTEGTCIFNVTIPRASKLITDLGTLTCVQR